MKLKVFLALLTGFLFLETSIINAQILVIHFKDGTTSTTMLKRIQSLGFSQSDLLKKLKTGGVNTYSISNIRKLTFADLPAPVSQNITLTSGWNSMSSYIIPDETDIEVLLAQIYPELIILQNMTEIYYPEGNVNTVENWECQSAFSIKVNQDVDLIITGQPEDIKTVQLTAGWNMLAVISNDEVNAENLFSGMGSNLQVVKEVASGGIYWPAFNINTIGNLQPGKAYLVNVLSAASVTFP